MGSERSSKEKKKSRKRSYDSSESEDEGKSKRHRGIEDEEKRSKKIDKKERKGKNSHKHRSDKDKKSRDKHNRKHHKDDHHLKQGFQELSTNDYFSKNNEFASWLKEEKRVFFSDLSSESAREMFSDFVKAWNNGKLESRYYEGIRSGPRTSHNWKIKK